MPSSTTLVVYFSRTGTTRKLAHDIARALNAETAELTEARTRGGVLGYLRSGFEATFRRLPPLRDFEDEAHGHALVVVGTPVWNANVCSPVRAFLRHHRGKFAKVAFFATMGGRGSERAFREMAEEAGRKPVASLAIVARDVATGKHQARVSAFAHELRQAVPVTTPSSAHKARGEPLSGRRQPS